MLTLLSASEGGTVMNRDGMELSGDTLVFDDNTGRLVSFGRQATFTPDEGNPVLTRQIIFDLNERRAPRLMPRPRPRSARGAGTCGATAPGSTATSPTATE